MFLSLSEMEKLNTKRLLAYKRKYLTLGCRPRCCSSYCNLFYVDRKKCKEECPNNYQELIEFEEAFNNIKQVLSKREHIERKGK